MMRSFGIATLSKMNSCDHTLRGLLLAGFVGAEDVGGPVGEQGFVNFKKCFFIVYE